MSYPRVEKLDRRLVMSALGYADPIAIAPVDAASFGAIADLNRDGKADIVSSSFGGGSLAVMLGNGVGMFQPKGKIPIIDAPDYVTSADLNGDQIRDLIAVSFSDNRVSVLIGKGDGTFASPARYPAPGVRAAVLGDFTGDAIPDLALAKSFDKGITILPGQAQGKFGTPVNQSFDFTPSDVVAADFDGNGSIDLATVDFFADKLHVLLNIGGGQFHLRQSLDTGAGPSALTAADFNGDGKADLATADFHGGGASVLLGNGDGTFAAAKRVASGGGATFVAAADIDNDSHHDLLVVHALKDTVSILLGNGDGSFDLPIDFATGTSPRSLALGDLNGDGQVDFVVANEASAALTAVISDSTAPSAGFDTPAPFTGAGRSTYDFTVTYTDDLVMSDTSLDNSDIVVSGPKGLSASATFVSSRQIKVSTRQAIYRLAAPGGFWEPSDNGRYTVALRANAVFDSAGNTLPAAVLGEFQVAIDDVGNGLSTARSLGTVKPGRIRAAEEYIGADDRNDFYRFEVTKAAEVYIKLYQMIDDADLQLLDGKGNRLAYSKQLGAAAETVRKNLSPGIYYARVLFTRGGSGTGYRLRLEALTPLPPPTNNNSLNSATNLGALPPGKVRALEQTVGIHDRNDFYRFRLTAASDVQLKLTKLKGNADLQLLDSSGKVIGQSQRGGASNETLARSLQPGTYFVRVLFRSGDRFTPYRLRIAVTYS